MPVQTISSSCLKTGATFFFRHMLAVLLSLKEIVVGGFSYLYTRLRAFLAKYPLFYST
jgi:hypothetical protein